MKLQTFFSLAITIFLIASCKKEEQVNSPGVTVDLYMYASSPAFSSLHAVGGWTYLNGGVRGIIIYRRTSDEFMAYERNCTYQSSTACATVYVDASSVVATDTCCGSQFALYDGGVLEGPASNSLWTYRTSWDGNTLHIYN